MRKQELIHLHGLLAAVSRHCEETGASVNYEEYDALDVQPTSIHRSKGDHQEAVLALAGGITDGVTRTETADASPTAAD
jgi:hypothetical protein